MHTSMISQWVHLDDHIDLANVTLASGLDILLCVSCAGSAKSEGEMVNSSKWSALCQEALLSRYTTGCGCVPARIEAHLRRPGRTCVR